LVKHFHILLGHGSIFGDQRMTPQLCVRFANALLYGRTGRCFWPWALRPLRGIGSVGSLGDCVENQLDSVRTVRPLENESLVLRPVDSREAIGRPTLAAAGARALRGAAETRRPAARARSIGIRQRRRAARVRKEPAVAGAGWPPRMKDGGGAWGRERQDAAGGGGATRHGGAERPWAALEHGWRARCPKMPWMARVRLSAWMPGSGCPVFPAMDGCRQAYARTTRRTGGLRLGRAEWPWMARWWSSVASSMDARVGFHSPSVFPSSAAFAQLLMWVRAGGVSACGARFARGSVSGRDGQGAANHCGKASIHPLGSPPLRTLRRTGVAATAPPSQLWSCLLSPCFCPSGCGDGMRRFRTVGGRGKQPTLVTGGPGLLRAADAGQVLAALATPPGLRRHAAAASAGLAVLLPGRCHQSGSTNNLTAFRSQLSGTAYLNACIFTPK
jgi:hypothetical protein